MPADAAPTAATNPTSARAIAARLTQLEARTGSEHCRAEPDGRPWAAEWSE